MRNHYLSSFILVALFTFLSTSASARVVYTAETVPNPVKKDSYVSNPDGILTPLEERALSDRLKQIERSTTNEVSVVLVNSIGDKIPKDFAVELFEEWGIGKADADNGVLLLFVMDQRRIEIEVGYGLEGVLTDFLCASIIRNEMIPHMKEGKVAIAIGNALTNFEEAFEGKEVPVTSTHEEVFGLPVEMLPFTLISGIIVIFFIILPFGWTMLNHPKAFLTGLFKVIISLAILAGIISAFTTFLYLPNYTKLALVYVVFNLGTVIYACRKNQLSVANYVFAKDDALPFSDFQKKFLVISVAILKLSRFLVVQRRLWLYGQGETFVDESEEDNYLSAKEKTEEEIGSIEYEVFRNEMTGEAKFIPNVIPFGKYKECPKCSARAEFKSKDDVLVKATTSNSGEGKRTYECLHCSATRTETYTIPKIPRSSSSGGSSGRSGSGSSFGGGRSGGGGAGGSW